MRRCGCWWNRFGPLFAADVRRQRVSRMRGFRQWKWHLDEVYVKINGEMHYLWRAVDQEGESPRELRYEDQRQGSGSQVHEEGAQAPRLTRGDHHRRAALVQGCNERARQCREAGDRPLGQQQGGELTPAVPATRAGNAAVPADEEPAEIRLRSMPTSTTTSILNATSSTERPTRPAARPPWPSGSRLWPEAWPSRGLTALRNAFLIVAATADPVGGPMWPRLSDSFVLT